MNQSLPDVAIVLVSWNTRDLTLECITSLTEALGPYTGTIWVVDNGSHDGSVAAIEERFPDVHIIANHENAGFAAANNQAIKQSISRYVLLLNTDTVADPGSIAALIRFADGHPQAGMVGPMLLNPDRSYQGSCADQPTVVSELLSASGLGVRIFGRWYPNYSPEQTKQPRRAGYIQGACMLVRRTTIDQVGLMDEQYFMYSEEPDWCLRMARSGWEIWYTPEAKILHYGGQSTQQRRHAMVIALYRSKVRFFAKHYGRVHALLFCSLLFIILQTKRALQKIAAALRPTTRIGPAISWRELQAGPIQMDQRI